MYAWLCILPFASSAFRQQGLLCPALEGYGVVISSELGGLTCDREGKGGGKESGSILCFLG